MDEENFELSYVVFIIEYYSYSTIFERSFTAQKMKFSIKDFFSNCDQIHSFPQIWSHLLKKSLKENFFFCAVF